MSADEQWSHDERRLLERIERELQGALSIAPSAGFAAQARARATRKPGRQWPWWLAAATAAGLLLLLWPRRTPLVAPSVGPARAAVERVAPREAPATPPPAPTRPMVAADGVRVPHSLVLAPRAGAGQPEVLVPAGEQEALRRYLEALQRRQLGPRLPRLAGGLEGGRPGLGVAPLEPLAPLGIPAVPSRELDVAPIRIPLIGV